MRALFLVASAFAVVEATSAQSPLVYSADTLIAPSANLVVSNPTSEPVSLDSIAVRFTAPDGFQVWILDVSVEGKYVYTGFANLRQTEPAQPIGLDIPGGGSGAIYARYDPCGVCRRAVRAVGRADTLLVYANGTSQPDTLFLDRAGVVSNEGDPEPRPFRVSVSPNPVTGTAVVSIEAERPETTARAAVLDALGRRVADFHTGPLRAGVQTFDFDMSDLSPGVYILRLEGAGWVTSSRVVMAR